MRNLIEIPDERIISRIFFIRDVKVMFDKDLAELYGVPTKVLNQAVRRNIKRFPGDFMFKLNKEESRIWVDVNSRSQFVTLKHGKNVKYLPYVFTEQGIAMLSSVLKSEAAININVKVIRTFTKLREILSDNKKLSQKIEEMEKKYDTKISKIFDIIKLLVTEKSKPKNPPKIPIGFKSK